MRKILLIPSVIILLTTACDDEPEALKADELKDEPSLIYVKTVYLERLNFLTNDAVDRTEDDFLWDTSRVVLQFDNRPYNGENLTSIEEIETGSPTAPKRLLKLHEAFFDHIEAQNVSFNFRLMYYIHAHTGQGFDCQSPMRELKTIEDVEAYLFLSDSDNWECVSPSCCPVKVMTNGSTNPICVDIESYWFRNFKSYPNQDYAGMSNPVYDFIKFEDMLEQHNLSDCD